MLNILSLTVQHHVVLPQHLQSQIWHDAHVGWHASCIGGLGGEFGVSLGNAALHLDLIYHLITSMMILDA